MFEGAGTERVSDLLKRISTILAARRETFLTAFLWCSMAAVICLPAFSQVGYPVWSPEYALAASTAVIAGSLFYAASKIRFVRPLLVVVLSATAFLLYFGGILLENYRLLYLVCPAFGAFTVFAFSRPEAALRIGGFAAFAQIAVTALATPGPFTVLMDKDVAPGTDAPSVIHILMDAHAGTAAFPETAVTREDAGRLEQIYLSRGFTVFRRAYSADTSTHSSIARLFNPSLDERLYKYDRQAHGFSVIRAKTLEQISEQRALDLTFTDHVDLSYAVQHLPNVVRLRRYLASGGGNTSGLKQMPLADRLWTATAMVRFWFLRRARSPLAGILFKFTDPGRHWDRLLQPASRVSPLISREIFRDMASRLECCGQRGIYTFVHLIHPHSPFLFDETCSILPSRAWLLPVNHRPGKADTLQTWNDRWRRHYEQAYCAGTDVGRLVDELRRHKALSDAVVIVHGDHGSRITIEDYEERGIDGYDAATYERDFRGTFFAVRIPGVREGKVIETPARIDDLYRQLVESDFRDLDPEALKQRANSPYADWQGARN